MKTMYKLLLSFVAIATIALFISCEGPAGPAGADGTNGIDGVDGTNGADGADGANGADGADGINGTDGTDGVDGNVSCLVCHTQANMDAIKGQYALSGHNAAAYVGYTSGAGRASCARCHNNEGFLYYLDGPEGALATDVFNATKIDCETCHGNHGSLEDGISAPIRTQEPVEPIVVTDLKFDLGGPSNLCMNCHQSRSNGASIDNVTTAKTYTRKFTGADIARYTNAAKGPAGTVTLNATSDTLTVVFDVPTANVYINSTRAYPHYGPMANMLHSIDGYITGTVAAPAHKELGCVSCHMGAAGDAEGGHTFFPNVENCQDCHTTADFDVNGHQTSVQADLALIEAKLIALNVLYIDAEGHPANLYGSITREQFQGYWNYQYLVHDMSSGLHNPAYSKEMIKQAKLNLGL